MNKTDVLKNVVVAAVGGIVGVVGMTWVASSSEPPATKSKEAELDLGQLERDIEERITRRLDKPSSVAHVAADAPVETAEARQMDPLAEPPQDPEEAKRELQEQFATDIDQHRADARDQSWAGRAEQGVESAIRKTDGTHKFVNVDCRTSSCLADVEWPNFDEAVSGYAKLLHARYEPNCAVKILFDDVVDKGAPVTETLVFDCTESRAN